MAPNFNAAGCKNLGKRCSAPFDSKRRVLPRNHKKKDTVSVSFFLSAASALLFFCRVCYNCINKMIGENQMVREATPKDLNQLLELYLHLHEKNVPENNEFLNDTWQKIMNDENHHIIVAEENGKIISSCVCVIIPNLTRNVRPYAFIENVVTAENYRHRGFASACLGYARDIAKKNNCYKMMLLTGSKNDSTLEFYKKAGYNCNDKTAFILWL